MSWVTMSENKTCKARKKHRCDVCDEAINPGETQVTRSGVQEREGWYTMHMHPICEEYSRKWDSMQWECHSPGDVTYKEVLKAIQEEYAK